MVMAALPAQLHVKLDVSDHDRLAKLAKRRKVTRSEVIRQLIQDARLDRARPSR